MLRFPCNLSHLAQGRWSKFFATVIWFVRSSSWLLCCISQLLLAKPSTSCTLHWTTMKMDTSLVLDDDPMKTSQLLLSFLFLNVFLQAILHELDSSSYSGFHFTQTIHSCFRSETTNPFTLFTKQKFTFPVPNRNSLPLPKPKPHPKTSPKHHLSTKNSSSSHFWSKVL